MNLITCAKSCRWQRDGLCTLEDISALNLTCSPECCFYAKQDRPPNA